MASGGGGNGGGNGSASGSIGVLAKTTSSELPPRVRVQGKEQGPQECSFNSIED